MKIFVPVLFSAFIIINGCKTNSFNEISDGFESDSLSDIWSSDKFIPGALELQSANVRSGKKAAKLTLRQGDQIEEEKGTVLERAELKEPKRLMSLEDSDYSYSFSIFLPDDFPISSTRLVLAQWKQNCQSGNCDPDNPVIALRYESGEFRVTLQTGPDKTTLYRLDQSILGKWLDFKFQIRFSRTQNGIITAFMNGNRIVDFNGITAYSQKYGYPPDGKFYFKVGLYRDTMPQIMTIYIDDYRKQLLRNL